ncbi:predicted protein, partial [Nematostella vectensis]
MSGSDERFAFLAEWYDPQAALTRKYQLLFYASDNSVEMIPGHEMSTLRVMSIEHEILKDDHEILEGEHEILEDEHEILEGEHEILEDEHEILEEYHDFRSTTTRTGPHDKLAIKYDLLFEIFGVFSLVFRLGKW